MPRAAKMTDVTVVGAGPAGAMTAYYLAALGLQVQIIEKRKFPRHKLCGGWLTRRALQEIPFDLSEVVEDVGHTIQLSIGERLIMKRRFSPPPIVLVRRERFDAFLVKKALRAGARFQDNTAFQGLSGSFGNLVVQTSRGTFRSKVIVGAEGTQSRVRKALGCRGPLTEMVALAAAVRPSGPGAMAAFRSRIDFDFQRKWMGYGWVFPKKSELSVGVMFTGSRHGAMKSHFYDYLHHKSFQDADVEGLSAHRIPCTPGLRFHLSEERGILAGLTRRR
jgi:geranylgeranyl reductase family protein